MYAIAVLLFMVGGVMTLAGLVGLWLWPKQVAAALISIGLLMLFVSWGIR